MISPEILRRYPWFAGLSEQVLKAIALISEEKETKQGEVLFEEGDPAKCLILVVEGEVDLTFEGEDSERYVVDTVIAGQPFCWSSLVEPYQETSTAVVRSPGKLVCINGSQLRDLCDADFEVGYLLMLQVAKVLRQRLLGARLQLIASAVGPA